MEERKRTNKKYKAEFKISVIMDMRTNNLGYRETMKKYFPGFDVRNFKFIKTWERIYLEEGAEGLMKERRGRYTKAENPKIGRPSKLDKTVEEDLISENQRLRMENEYIKKLQALILAEKREKNKKQ